MDIKDRIVVITGAAGGIGRALAVACADAGARAVVCADLDG
ncbi:short-chain dehydrogenase, partial [Alcanivorax marinus]